MPKSLLHILYLLLALVACATALYSGFWFWLALGFLALLLVAAT
jgi:hypothetical protein